MPRQRPRPIHDGNLQPSMLQSVERILRDSCWLDTLRSKWMHFQQESKKEHAFFARAAFSKSICRMALPTFEMRLWHAVLFSQASSSSLDFSLFAPRTRSTRTRSYVVLYSGPKCIPVINRSHQLEWPTNYKSSIHAFSTE